MSKKLYLRDVRRVVEKSKRTVSRKEVEQAHQRSVLGGLSLVLLDTKYVALSVEAWELFLRYSKVNEIKYVPETQDCDDFAKILTGECHRKLHVNGIGIVIDWSSGHAYNELVAYDDDGELLALALEPQGDQWVLNRGRMHAGRCGFVTM